MHKIVLIGISVWLLAPPAWAQQATGENVIFFLHNAWYEKNTGDEVHPKFGRYDFQGIKAALTPAGKVRAPERGADADPGVAADALVKDVQTLIAAGMAPGNIKVIGTSKGGQIAQLASARLNQPGVRWVLVGGCHNARMAKGNIPRMSGKVLSIYDTSDKIAGPCQPFAAMYKDAESFKEVATATGRDHGFQFTADKAWIDPALAW